MFISQILVEYIIWSALFNNLLRKFKFAFCYIRYKRTSFFFINKRPKFFSIISNIIPTITGELFVNRVNFALQCCTKKLKFVMIAFKWNFLCLTFFSYECWELFQQWKMVSRRYFVYHCCYFSSHITNLLKDLNGKLAFKNFNEYARYSR